MSKQQLKLLTKSLIQYTSILEATFNDATIGQNNDTEFFNYVRSDTEDVFAKLSAWETIVLDLNQLGKINIPEAMVQSTKDNMTALIMHSYYKDVRRRRYMEIKRSCIYVYQTVLKELS